MTNMRLRYALCAMLLTAFVTALSQTPPAEGNQGSQMDGGKDTVVDGGIDQNITDGKGMMMGKKVAQVDGGIDPLTEENPYFILVGEAEKAIGEQAYDEAAARIIDAMAVEPDNPGNIMLMSNLGMVYSYMDRDSLAIATLDEVMRRAPRMTVALVNRGKVKLKMQKNDDAYKDFERVLAMDSLNTDALYFRGMLALYSGNKAQATADLEQLHAILPEQARTWIALSTLYSMTGRDREAAKYFEKLIEACPSVEFYAGLAGCYLALENLSEASRVISEGLKLYGHDPELYYYRAWLNRERFRFDDAKRDAQLALKYGASPEKVGKLFKR